MNDREFDALLESAAPELPPDDVARDVTPWRRAIGNILGGSALCSITLNFFCLNYLLPTIGVILQLLGFRPLRRENGWFRACWLLAVLRAALFLPCIVLNATIYSNAVYASSVGTALSFGDKLFFAALMAFRFGLPLGLIVAFIVCAIYKRQLKSVRRATEAARYTVSGGAEITAREDRFTHTTEVRTPIKTESDDHDSGPSFSGGTTVNSGGFSHSGGKF